MVKDWLLIAFSWSVIADQITAINLVGYALAFLGVCWYNNRKLQVGPTSHSHTHTFTSWVLVSMIGDVDAVFGETIQMEGRTKSQKPDSAILKPRGVCTLILGF